MKKQNAIGLDAARAGGLAEKLNGLLANYQLFYINARGFHWNIKGDKFFELHAKFEDIYNDALLKVDEVAERILTLGFTPMHTFADYIKASDIKQATNISNGKEAVTLVLDGYKTLISMQRELLELSAEAGDEGTNALMSDYIREQEKLVWMYNAFMG